MTEINVAGENGNMIENETMEMLLTQEEKDVIGEIANISFGSASTVLSTLLNKPVNITAPSVEVLNIYDTSDVEIPHAVLNIHFTKGLDMENLLVIKQDVALAIADLMMMGTGEVDPNAELSELELSAVQEAMNQMMGFAATSMSEFFHDMVDMSPPTIRLIKLIDEMEKITKLDENSYFVKVSLDLTVGDLVNSKLVQIMSIGNAKEMVAKLMSASGSKKEEVSVQETELVDEDASPLVTLTQQEKDVLGEISNISIGSASTVLSSLLNQKVHISVPNIETIKAHHYDGVAVPFVVLDVDFIEGIRNKNVFVLSKEVALTMVDLMMMGTGNVDPNQELTELEESGVKEIMNQMMGHAATSMSELFGEKIDITPPSVKVITLEDELSRLASGNSQDELVQVTFNIEIGDLIQSKIYQFLMVPEAKEMVQRLLPPTEDEEETIVEKEPEPYELVDWNEVSQQSEVQITQETKTTPTQNDDLLQNVELNLEFVFGSTMQTIQDILSLNDNERVLLDENIDEPIQIYANGVLIAYGELVNVDGFFGVKVLQTA
ncbi:flagellar motor switch protein [Microbacteriaceae bacterium 4G12]